MQCDNAMSALNSMLKSFDNNDDKLDYMYSIFTSIKRKVDAVLLFGPSNSPIAEQATNTFYNKKHFKNSLFPVTYTKKEIAVLPAVIATRMQLEEKSENVSPSEKYESYLKRAYLYGTGTCELFSIVGAYFLATEFDVEVTIETIMSNNTHTYIRLNTNPEYIMDFWATMFCEYDNSREWNDFFGLEYIRNKDSEFKKEIQLNSTELIALGNRIFTEKNTELRLKIINDVSAEVQKELSTVQPDATFVIETSFETATLKG